MPADRPHRLSRRAVLALAALAVLLVAAGAGVTHALSTKAKASAAHPPPLYPVAQARAVVAPLDAARAAADRDARRWLATHPAANLAAGVAWAMTQIPAPPTGAAQRAELAALHRLPPRTPAGDAAAAWAEQNGPKAIWKLYLKQYAQLTGTPQGKQAKALLKATLKAAQQAQATLKTRFARPSPYITDPTLGALNQDRFAKKLSYPSKHATMAVAAVTILDRLEPLRAPEFERMLDEILYSRLYARGHYPSDLTAGERLGRLIADVAVHDSPLPSG